MQRIKGIIILQMGSELGVYLVFMTYDLFYSRLLPLGNEEIGLVLRSKIGIGIS